MESLYLNLSFHISLCLPLPSPCSSFSLTFPCSSIQSRISPLYHISLLHNHNPSLSILSSLFVLFFIPLFISASTCLPSCIPPVISDYFPSKLFFTFYIHFLSLRQEPRVSDRQNEIFFRRCAENQQRRRDWDSTLSQRRTVEFRTR